MHATDIEKIKSSEFVILCPPFTLVMIFKIGLIRTVKNKIVKKALMKMEKILF